MMPAAAHPTTLPPLCGESRNHLCAAERRSPIQPTIFLPLRGARAPTFPPLHGDSPNYLPAAARRTNQPPLRCFAAIPPSIYLQNPPLPCGQRLFRFKKTLCFSSKPIVLGADLGARVFMVFYNKNCPQRNPPILVSFS
jgi:hypothetical protein